VVRRLDVRRFLLLLPLVGLALAGCSSTVERTPQAPAELQPFFFPAENAFLADLGRPEGVPAQLSDADLVRVGQGACHALFAKTSRQAVINSLVNWPGREFPQPVADKLVTMARKNMCDQAPLG
jgi:hypothetical protein